MEFDYIVVGAGSAGCVLASRLSENPHISVLLLEAGNEDVKPEIHDPRQWQRLLGSEVDWGYTTEPEPALAGRRIPCQRGKVLGGSSAINAMIYIRGNPWDFDHWCALGCPGWGYADTLPYFLKSEHQERGASQYHQVGGPLSVSDVSAEHPLFSAIFAATAETGIPRNPDFNGERQEGCGLYQFTVKAGRRQSAAVAFLQPARSHGNLTILTQALASCLLVDGDRVRGVSFQRNGTEEHAVARREVILSGGAINSPQLLLLSGIGPEEELRAMGIPMVKNLPGVGKNLHDHPTVTLGYGVPAGGPIPAEHVLGGAFLYSGVDPHEPAPDIQFHILLQPDATFQQVAGFGLTVTQLRPESRGQIRLRSASPLDPPRVEINYLAHPGDMARMMAGVQRARQVCQSPALAKRNVVEVEPGANRDMEDFVRQETWGIWHPVGTCKMGQDALAVVDAQMRVHGLHGLRVADSSVMPQVTSGNTNAPTIMIAERAADWIKASQG